MLFPTMGLYLLSPEGGACHPFETLRKVQDHFTTRFMREYKFSKIMFSKDTVKLLWALAVPSGLPCIVQVSSACYSVTLDKSPRLR